MKNLPIPLSKPLKALTEIATSSANIGHKTQKLSPHIKLVYGIVIEGVVKKSDYAEDLSFFGEEWRIGKRCSKSVGDKHLIRI